MPLISGTGGRGWKRFDASNLIWSSLAYKVGIHEGRLKHIKINTDNYTMQYSLD